MPEQAYPLGKPKMPRNRILLDYFQETDPRRNLWFSKRFNLDSKPFLLIIGAFGALKLGISLLPTFSVIRKTVQPIFSYFQEEILPFS